MVVNSSFPLLFVDRCLPARLSLDAETVRRARLIAVSALALTLACLLLAASRFVLQGWRSPAGLILLASGVAFGLVPVVIRQLAAVRLAGSLLPAIGMAGILGMCLVEAGLYSEALYWAPFVPLAAILMAPRAMAMVITGLSTAIFFVLFVLHLDGRYPGVELGAEALVLRACGGASAVVFGGLLGWFYERTRQRSQRRLWELANHNQLTGLPGRGLFFTELGRALVRRRTQPAAVALVLLDVDNLKAVNDSLGHAVGDELLKAVARRLAAATRESEMPFHLSGDEFTVILELDRAASAAVAVERIRATVEQPCAVAASTLVPRVSLGLAVAETEDTVEDLFKRADAAMYADKSRRKASDPAACPP